MDILERGTVKTRKEHKCHQCNDVIPIGTMVDSGCYVNDGLIYRLWVCDVCVAFIDKYIKDYFWDGIIEEGDVLNCDEYESFKNNYKEAQNDR